MYFRYNLSIISNFNSNNVAYPIQLTFKCVANTSVANFSIDGGAATIDGNASPYVTGMATYDSITVYSNGTNLFII